MFLFGFIIGVLVTISIIALWVAIAFRDIDFWR